MKPRSPQLLADYIEFTRHSIASRDVDPVYPVLRYLADPLPDRQAAWLCFLYAAHYNTPSAWQAFAAHPMPERVTTRCPIGTNRRGLRVQARMLEHTHHIAALDRAYGGIDKWIAEQLTDDPRESWRTLNAALAAIPGNGRYFAYKIAEIARDVLDVPVEPTDMGHIGSTGPRRGLAKLYTDVPIGNAAKDIAALDRVSDDLLTLLRSNGVMCGIEQAETTLCGFKSLCDGQHYVGIDIDKMQSEALKQPESSVLIWNARAATLPPEYLGEVNGWTGIDKQRMGEYRSNGRILTR